MPRRRRLGEHGGGPTARRHLYLLFDDCPGGYTYSIRKVADLPPDDVGSDDPHGWQTAAHVSGEGEVVCTGEHRLPPAIFRFEAQRGLPMHFAAAFDSKILAMQPIAPATAVLPPLLENHVTVFDVRMRSCLFGPRPAPDPADPIYIPAGGSLFALAAGTFDMLYPPPPPQQQQLHVPPAYGEEPRVWSWRKLPDPPFERKHVTSYAVHPDGQTIFVSIKNGDSAATFAFNAGEQALKDGGVWKRHGQWALPFAGRAHFDDELDAWVGISTEADGIGHLCSCDAVPASPDDAAGDGQCPARKLSKEKLLTEHPTERHVGATLVYMGGRSSFCLVHCVSIGDDDGYADDMSDRDLEDGDDCSDDDEETSNDSDMEEGDSDMEEEDSCAADDDTMSDCDLEEEDDVSADDVTFHKQEEQGVSRTRRYFFRLTSFNLKYDKNGDLTTGSSRRVRYYRVPKESTQALLCNPVAFSI